MPEDLWIEDDDGMCIARDNLLIAFFAKCSFSEIVDGANYCFERFLQTIPENVLKWSLVGGSTDSFKPLTPKVLNRCRSMLTAATAGKKNVHFRLRGPTPAGPAYSLIVSGYKAPSNEGFLDQTNLIEMRFPRKFLGLHGEDDFVAMVLDLFDHCPCDSGYASISLCFGSETEYTKAGCYIVPMAFKSHGFDIPNNESTADELGDRCRGARWLTLLSNKLIDELGGRDALTEELSDGVEIINSSNGALLRAGRIPEIGDVNRSQPTPLVASVARAIEAVTFFDDSSLLPLFGDDEESQNRWERRFWPKERAGR